MLDFEEYIIQGEPDKVEKTHIWQTAIGLQQVDGLKPSAYLIETAKQNIEGDITFDEVKKRIDAYYKTQSIRQTDTDDRTEEADKVSARIAEILSEKTFSFSPAEYLNIHRRLFNGIYKFAGKIRDYNITKAEWVLDGETVLYASADTLKATLEYDFEQEKQFNYKHLSKLQIVEHIAHFIAYLWQIHIFGEGNTRTTAVFLIKYLRKLGFKNINNELFAEYSWYFRNALVRANYNDITRGIHRTEKYLIRFLSNILLKEKNVLKNRELHIHFDEYMMEQNSDKNANTPNTLEVNVGVKTQNVGVNDEKISVNASVNAGVNAGVKLTNNELKIIKLIKKNNQISYTEITKKMKMNESTIFRNIKKLKSQGIISRVGSDKTGHWEINYTVIN